MDMIRERLRSGTAPASRRVSSGPTAIRLGDLTHCVNQGRVGPPLNSREGRLMKWTKPEAEVVAVTMEVTAYVATL
jgi:hypothetical protein